MDKELELLLKNLFGTTDFAKIREAKSEIKPHERVASLSPKNLTLTADEVKSLAKKVGYVYQEGDEARVFQLTYTDETVDRYGDIVIAKGGDFTNYMKNAVILPFHDHRATPIGKTLKLEYDKAKKAIVGWLLIFNKTVDPSGVSEVFYSMLKYGGIQAGSIGFMPKTYKYPEEAERLALGMSEWGIIFDSWELLEFSLCSVPANPNALQNSLDKGVVSREDIRKTIETFRAKDLDVPQEWADLVSKLDSEESAPVEVTLAQADPTSPVLVTGNAPQPLITEKSVRKAIETWYEDEENYVREFRDIEEFDFSSLELREVEDFPGVTAFEGKLSNATDETKTLQAYHFHKDIWDLDEAKQWSPEADNTTKDIAELFGISIPEKAKIEKAGAVLSKKNKTLVQTALAAASAAITELSNVSTLLTDLLSAADSTKEEAIQTDDPVTGLSKSNGDLYGADFEAQVDQLFSNQN